MNPKGVALAKMIAKLASDKKAGNILILDLRKIDYVADFFVIASGESYVQVKAIADNIEERLSEQNVYLYHREEDKGYNWVLLDYSDVVVHVFEEGTRKFYSLERLWGDAKFIKLKGEYAGKYKEYIKKRINK